jgi:hypothetical protein
VPSFFSFFGFFVETQNFIDNFYVRQEHASAAISFDSQAVQHFASILSGLDPSGEFFPLVADQLAAGEASYWYDHSAHPSYL